MVTISKLRTVKNCLVVSVMVLSLTLIRIKKISTTPNLNLTRKMKLIEMLEKPKKKKNTGRKTERHASKWVIAIESEMKIEKLNNAKKRCKKLTHMVQVASSRNHLALS